MRFVLEIIARIQHKCGRDFPIGVRYSGEEWVRGRPRHWTKRVRVAKLLEEHGVAFVDISAGIFEAPAAVMDPMYYPQGWNTYTAEEVKKHVKIPVITSHTLRDPDYCEKILAEGKADLVGLSRQMIADPYWANKALRRPAGGDPQVHLLPGRLLAGIADDQAAHALRDQPGGGRRAVHRTWSRPRTSLPRGGGRRRPRRHGGGAHRHAARPPGDVFEKTGELGGAILYCCTVPGKHKMRWYADWLRDQMQKLGVEVRLHTSAGRRGARSVRRGDPGHRRPRRRGPTCPGIDLPLVVHLRRRAALPDGAAASSTPAASRRRPSAARRVLVWGDHFGAADAAEKLAAEGKQVYVVTENREFAPWMEPCHRDVMIKRFAGGNGEGLKGKPFAHPVTVIPNTTVTRSGPTAR